MSELLIESWSRELQTRTALGAWAALDLGQQEQPEPGWLGAAATSLPLTDLTPDTQEAVKLLLARAAALGMTAYVRSTTRSCALQNQIYAKGRTAPGAIETYAQGCNSWHVMRRAVDVTIVKGTEAQYAQLGTYWKGLGGKWGGDFAQIKDLGHYEWHPGLKIEQVCTNPAACQVDTALNGQTTMPDGAGEAGTERAGVGNWAVAGGFLLVAGGIFWATTRMSGGKRGRGRLGQGEEHAYRKPGEDLLAADDDEGQLGVGGDEGGGGDAVAAGDIRGGLAGLDGGELAGPRGRGGGAVAGHRCTVAQKGWRELVTRSGMSHLPGAMERRD